MLQISAEVIVLIAYNLGLHLQKWLSSDVQRYVN